MTIAFAATLVVATVAAEEHSFLGRSQLQGVAQPKLLAELPPAAPGIVSQVHVVEDQQVMKDQPLITLDNRVALAARKVAALAAARTAALRSAELQWQLSERQLRRIEQALANNASSPFEVEEKRVARDQARAAYDLAREDQIAAQAALELANAELRRFTIYSPFQGRVVKLNVHAGTAVEPTTPIVTVANFTELEVTFFLPVERFGSIQPGATVNVEAAVPVDRTLTGQVQSISPLLDAASSTFRCIVTIDNHERELPGGFSVLLQTDATSIARQ